MTFTKLSMTMFNKVYTLNIIEKYEQNSGILLAY